MSLKTEYVVIDRWDVPNTIRSVKGWPTREEAIAADRAAGNDAGIWPVVARLVSVDRTKGLATVEQWRSDDSGGAYRVETLPAPYLCKEIKEAEAAETKIEAKTWAGCPRNYPSYC